MIRTRMTRVGSSVKRINWRIRRRGGQRERWKRGSREPSRRSRSGYVSVFTLQAWGSGLTIVGSGRGVQEETGRAHSGPIRRHGLFFFVKVRRSIHGVPISHGSRSKLRLRCVSAHDIAWGRIRADIQVTVAASADRTVWAMAATVATVVDMVMVDPWVWAWVCHLVWV
jgi:hypothetical protein